MKTLLVTQRVVTNSSYSERRDALDQRWARFLEACGLLGVAVPNYAPTARRMLDALRPDGVLLTGGDDIAPCGGNTPERDEVERLLLEQAKARGIPLLGVCRGMQAIQHHYGVRLGRVNGHVAPRQEILVRGRPETVNSYHGWGTKDSPAALAVWAVAADGIVKAVADEGRRIVGVMWHPERHEPFRPEDIRLFRNHFGVETGS